MEESIERFAGCNFEYSGKGMEIKAFEGMTLNGEPTEDGRLYALKHGDIIDTLPSPI